MLNKINKLLHNNDNKLHSDKLTRKILYANVIIAGISISRIPDTFGAMSLRTISTPGSDFCLLDCNGLRPLSLLLKWLEIDWLIKFIHSDQLFKSTPQYVITPGNGAKFNKSRPITKPLFWLFEALKLLLQLVKDEATWHHDPGAAPQSTTISPGLKIPPEILSFNCNNLNALRHL